MATEYPLRDLRLGCSDAIPELVIENVKSVLSVGQATISDFSHIS